MNSKFQNKLNMFRMLAKDENNIEDLIHLAEQYKDHDWWITLFLPSIWNLIQGNLAIGLLGLFGFPFIALFFMIIGSTCMNDYNMAGANVAYSIMILILVARHILCIYVAYNNCEELNNEIDRIVFKFKRVE